MHLNEVELHEANAQELASRLAESVEGFVLGLLRLIEDAKNAQSLAAADRKEAEASKRSLENTYTEVQSLREGLNESVTSLRTELTQLADRTAAESSELLQLKTRVQKELQSGLAEMSARQAEVAEQLSESRAILEAAERARAIGSQVTLKPAGAEDTFSDSTPEKTTAKARQADLVAPDPPEDPVLVSLKAENHRVAENIRNIHTASKLKAGSSDSRLQSGMAPRNGVDEGGQPRALPFTIPKLGPIARLKNDQRRAAGDSLFGSIGLFFDPGLDFNSVVELDALLAELAPIGSVALERYSDQEIRFQVEITEPLSAQDLAQLLKRAAGVAVEVGQVGDDWVRLSLLRARDSHASGA
jgi:hypothetical protein